MVGPVILAWYFFLSPDFSIEFLNVGGWLSRGDLALESSAHFLAIAEHRLVPARARAVTTLSFVKLDVLQSGHRLVRMSLLVAMLGVGVISLHGASLSLPTLLDSSFKEFFRVGRAMRVVFPSGNGGVLHLFVVYGYQGADNDPEKLQLTEHLFAAVLAEARLCCAGQPFVLAGDFNVEPLVIPSLAKGISDGHWVDLEHAFSLVGVFPLLLLVSFSLMRIKALVGFHFSLPHCSGSCFYVCCLARSLVHSSFCCLCGVYALFLGCYCGKV